MHNVYDESIKSTFRLPAGFRHNRKTFLSISGYKKAPNDGGDGISDILSNHNGAGGYTGTGLIQRLYHIRLKGRCSRALPQRFKKVGRRCSTDADYGNDQHLNLLRHGTLRSRHGIPSSNISITTPAKVTRKVLVRLQTTVWTKVIPS